MDTISSLIKTKTMKENSDREIWKGKESKPGKTADATKETSRTAERKAKELWNGPTAPNTSEAGARIRCTEMASISMLEREPRGRENGLTEKGRTGFRSPSTWEALPNKKFEILI